MERLDSDSDAAVLLASDDASDGETNGDLTLDEAKADDMAKAHAMRPGDVSVSLRRSLTVCLSLAFFGLGLVLAMLGPSQRSLAALLNESIGNLAYIFTARSCGYLVGSVVSGWIFERFDALLMLAVTLSVTVIGQFLAPLCPSIALLSCTVVLQGWGMGFLDTGGNVLLLRIWGFDCGPYMQTLHFSFGLGAFVAPLIAQPFFVPVDFTPGVNGTTPEYIHAERIRIAYWIGMIPGLLAAIWATWFYLQQFCGRRDEIRALSRHQAPPEDEHSTSSDPRDTKKQKIFLVSFLLLLALFFMAYVGIEVAYGGFIYEFSVQSEVQFSAAKAAYLVSAFWGPFTIGRGLAIVLAYFKVGPDKLVAMDLTGTVSALTLLTVWGRDTPAVLWGGTVILGLSMASVFPSAVHMSEQFINVTGKAASVFVVGAAFGEMIMPLLVGKSMASSGPQTLMIASLATQVSALLVFGCVYLMGTRSRFSKAHRSKSGGGGSVENAPHKTRNGHTLLRSTEDDDEGEEQGRRGDAHTEEIELQYL